MENRESEIRKLISELTLIDNDYFRYFFSDGKKAAEEVIRVLLERSDRES